MKRWWNTSSYSASARVTRRRVGRALVRVVVAGAVTLPIAKPEIRAPRTSGAVIQAWAFGALSDPKQPRSSEGCDLQHVCELVISSTGGAGSGTGATLKTAVVGTAQVDPPTNLPFTMTETIDYQHPTTKGVHGDNGPGACYPGSGVITIAIDASSTLVLDIVGQACQVGSSTAQLLFTGSYVSDAASSGRVSNADAIGNVTINTPSGLPGTGTNLKVSLVGQLMYGN